MPAVAGASQAVGEWPLLHARPEAVARAEGWLAPGGECTRGCTTPVKLHWWGKSVGTEECTALSNSLIRSHGRLPGAGSSPKQIENLLLGMNSLTDECAAALAAAASTGAFAQLLSLGLSRNQLSDRGCAAIARSLTHMPELRDLFLSKEGGVGDACARALAAAFLTASAPKLTRLGLADNNITAAGLKALLQAAPAGLRELNLDNNAQCRGGATDPGWGEVRASTQLPLVSSQCQQGPARTNPRQLHQRGERRVGGRRPLFEGAMWV